MDSEELKILTTDLLQRLRKLNFKHLSEMHTTRSAKFEYQTIPDTGEYMRIAVELSKESPNQPRPGVNSLYAIFQIMAGPNTDQYLDHSTRSGEVFCHIYFHLNGDLDINCTVFDVYESWFGDWLTFNIERIINDQINGVIGRYNITQDSKVSSKIKKFFTFLD
jgi:hypothetical protein